ncbi:hypothetical protein FRC12_004550 [Ceratobasidium sp. 428]|nr:hypothetical protein FRC12_004550 [Ceratobasidium sp. 428]
MAAILAPSPVPLPRRAFRDGALLLANRAANLINVPATRNIARELRTLAKAMKAPAVNEENAQQQTNNIQQYAEYVETIAERISQLEGVDLSGTAGELWELLQEFDEYISNAIKELQSLQAESIMVKFTCQNEITRRLDAQREETMWRVLAFCFKLSLLANYTIIQTQARPSDTSLKHLIGYEVSAALYARGGVICDHLFFLIPPPLYIPSKWHQSSVYWRHMSAFQVGHVTESTL